MKMHENVGKGTEDDRKWRNINPPERTKANGNRTGNDMGGP
jgi:hypothetical protein